MWLARTAVDISLSWAVAILPSIGLVLFMGATIALSQEGHPAYLTPPGSEYPQPAPGAQPPIIYNPYEWDFESREALELNKAKFPLRADQEKERDQEAAKSDENKSPEKPSLQYRPVRDPESVEPSSRRTPMPFDSQGLGQGSWVRPEHP